MQQRSRDDPKRLADIEKTNSRANVSSVQHLFWVFHSAHTVSSTLGVVNHDTSQLFVRLSIVDPFP